MKLIITLCLIFGLSNISYGFGGRRNIQSHPQTYYYPQYYYYPQTYSEKIVIPVRETKLAEIKGLKIVEDKDNIKYIIVNGKLYNIENWQEKVLEDFKEYKQNNKIIIEKQITY